MQRYRVLALCAALLLPAGGALAETKAVGVDGFYCGELSSREPATQMNFLHLGDALPTATWAGVVRAPKVQPGAAPLAWCRERMSQDVNPAGCRETGNPAIEAGPLRFEVVETVIGEPTGEIEIAPSAGVRLLLNTDHKPIRPDSACTQAFRTDGEGASVYYSPAIIGLDANREYVLVVKPRLSGPGVWGGVFALVEKIDETKESVRIGAERARSRAAESAKGR